MKKAKWELSHSFPILFSLSKLLLSFEIGTATLVVFKKQIVARFHYTWKSSLLGSTFLKTYMLLQNVVSTSYYGVFECWIKVVVKRTATVLLKQGWRVPVFPSCCLSPPLCTLLLCCAGIAACGLAWCWVRELSHLKRSTAKPSHTKIKAQEQKVGKTGWRSWGTPKAHHHQRDL